MYILIIVRRFFVIILAVFILVDVFLAIYLFIPNLASSIIRLIPTSKISVSSAIPNKRVSFSNEAYLNKKLIELNFWGDNRVLHYPKTATLPLERVTVERLKLILTDKPQEYGRNTNSPTGIPVNFSYGQLYNPTTREMTLLIHLDSSFTGIKSLDSGYTGVVLFAIFDLIHPRPFTTEDKKDATYRKLGLSYIQDFYKNPEKYSIFNIY